MLIHFDKQPTFLPLPKLNFMKRKTLFFALALLVMGACSRRVATPAVQLLDREGSGLLTIAATGFGFAQYKTEQDARRLVLERLLYAGIADATITDARLPLIADQSKLTSTQKGAIDGLFADSDRYFQSVAKSDMKPQWSENLKRTQNFVLRVNYDLLRRDLENKSIIRKFGI